MPRRASEMRTRTIGLVAAIAAAGVLSTTPARGAHPDAQCLSSLVSRTCHDDDGLCDGHRGPGCRFTTSLCLHRGPASEDCPHGPTDEIRVRRPLLRGPHADTTRALLDALAALGGSVDRRKVSFASPPDADCAFFDVFVPREGDRAEQVVLATRGRAGHAWDADWTRYTCLPPNPGSDHAPPLSSGCRSDMDLETCTAHDGEFAEQAGLLQRPHCFCRTDDFGRVCTHNRQCQGFCLTNNPAARAGVCAKYVISFGCFLMFLSEGTPSAICVD